MSKAALISVSDKSGVVDFAKELVDLGYILLSTGGTGKHLKEAGLSVLPVEEYTGQKEILDGRVKTLHPKIHAGLLARRDSAEHLKQLEADEILQIDLAVINLYPFTQNLESEKSLDYKKMIELVDIGGPTMIRAAAKNFSSVYPVIDSKDYSHVISCLKGEVEDSLAFRCELAYKVFKVLADYNLQIARYFGDVDISKEEQSFSPLSSINGVVLSKMQDLRYGENPHQKAKYYSESKDLPWEQLGGKELSYNNLLDLDASARLISSFASKYCIAAINKHLNPCGAAIAEDLSTAIINAKKGDPRSHFGGIISVNKTLDLAGAKEVTKDFCEIIIAPDYEEDALVELKTKKNLRIIKFDYTKLNKTEIRTCAGGYLIQELDSELSKVNDAEQKSGDPLSDIEREDLEFAWELCPHVKSNAVVIVKDKMLCASGAGQMSRIDSVEVATLKANTHGHNLQGAVAASDAFFPFPDSVEKLAQAGIKAIITTGGASRDEEVISMAKEKGIKLFFTKDRHFKH